MEHEAEPIPGLPERLPLGEGILWQGSPRWWSLAQRALHLRALSIYFGLLVTWSVFSAFTASTSLTEALAAAGTSAGLEIFFGRVLGA